MVTGFSVQQRLFDFRGAADCGRLCIDNHWHTVELELSAGWQCNCLISCINGRLDWRHCALAHLKCQ